MLGVRRTDPPSRRLTFSVAAWMPPHRTDSGLARAREWRARRDGSQFRRGKWQTHVIIYPHICLDIGVHLCLSSTSTLTLGGRRGGVAVSCTAPVACARRQRPVGSIMATCVIVTVGCGVVDVRFGRGVRACVRACQAWAADPTNVAAGNNQVSLVGRPLTSPVC